MVKATPAPSKSNPGRRAPRARSEFNVGVALGPRPGRPAQRGGEPRQRPRQLLMSTIETIADNLTDDELVTDRSRMPGRRPTDSRSTLRSGSLRGSRRARRPSGRPRRACRVAARGRSRGRALSSKEPSMRGGAAVPPASPTGPHRSPSSAVRRYWPGRHEPLDLGMELPKLRSVSVVRVRQHTARQAFQARFCITLRR